MARKYDLISALAEATAQDIVKKEAEWAKYLESASRVYRYPFKDQLLIYAQRPDATACASLEFWNEKMNCWVNKGAKGIALIDDSYDRGQRLKYVFDVSDVHKARRIGKDPNLWKMQEEHKEGVLKRLENIYGETDSEKSFEQRIVELSNRIALDYQAELLPDLKYMIEGSFLEGYDEQNLEVRLRDTLASNFMHDFDPHEYNNQVEDRQAQVDTISKDLQTGEAGYITSYLQEIISQGAGTTEEQKKAQELIAQIQEYKPLAKVEEMEEQNYNQIDNVLNNGFEQKKEEKEKEARGEDKSDKRPSLKKRLEEKKEQVASEPGKPVPEKDKTKSNRRSLLGE